MGGRGCGGELNNNSSSSSNTVSQCQCLPCLGGWVGGWMGCLCVRLCVYVSVSRCICASVRVKGMLRETWCGVLASKPKLSIVGPRNDLHLHGAVCAQKGNRSRKVNRRKDVEEEANKKA
jgi:hypothetical protein